MTTTAAATDRDPERLAAALRLVLRRYAAQIRRRPAIAIPALLLPGIGDVLIFYAPPLVVARLLGAFARDEQLSAARPGAVRPDVCRPVAGRRGDLADRRCR